MKSHYFIISTLIVHIILFFIFPMILILDPNNEPVLYITVMQSIWDAQFGVFFVSVLVICFIVLGWNLYYFLGLTQLSNLNHELEFQYKYARNKFLIQVIPIYIIIQLLMEYGTDEYLRVLYYSENPPTRGNENTIFIDGIVLYNGGIFSFWLSLTCIILVIYALYDNLQHDENNSRKWVWIQGKINSKFSVNHFNMKYEGETNRLILLIVTFTSYLISAILSIELFNIKDTTLLTFIAICLVFTQTVVFTYYLILGLFQFLNIDEKHRISFKEVLANDKVNSCIILSGVISLIPDNYNLNTDGVIVIFTAINFFILTTFYFLRSNLFRSFA